MAITTTNKTATSASERDNWRTRREVFERVEQVLGIRFDLDAAATPHNALCEAYICDTEVSVTTIPAGRMPRAFDTLKTDWWLYGSTAWLNPPFSRKEAFSSYAAMMAEDGMTVACMLPHSPDTAWYQRVEMEADTILLPDKRINFDRPDGTPVNGVSFYSCVALFTPWGGKMGPARQVRFSLKPAVRRVEKAA